MAYLTRSIDAELLKWKESPRRKPLLVRGARQVGKSCAIRHLGETFKYYLEINLDGNITLGETAAYMKMNKSALCKFVKKHTGNTFTDYVNSLRLEKAALLLASTTDPACDIAYDCGFTSIPYFHRLFSRTYGTTPCNYRKKCTSPTPSR